MLTHLALAYTIFIITPLLLSVSIAHRRNKVKQQIAYWESKRSE